MVFSKSFGYALRSVLYVALAQRQRPFVQADEIANELGVPRHFMGKVLNRLVKSGILLSLKGKTGGFALASGAKNTTLMELFRLVDDADALHRCALRLQQCNDRNPCPVHAEMARLRADLKALLTTTTISKLLAEDKEGIVNGIVTKL